MGGVCLVILALSPLLMLGDIVVRPLAKSQYVARTAAGLIIASIVVFIWAYASNVRGKLPAFVVLGTAEAGRRFLLFSLLILLAVLPSDIFLTQSWVSYLDTMRKTVRNHDGVIAFEDSPLSSYPYNLLVEDWILPSQSLALRAKRGDGIVAPPKQFQCLAAVPAAGPVSPRQLRLARLACAPCARLLPIGPSSCCCGAWPPTPPPPVAGCSGTARPFW